MHIPHPKIKHVVSSIKKQPLRFFAVTTLAAIAATVWMFYGMAPAFALGGIRGYSAQAATQRCTLQPRVADSCQSNNPQVTLDVYNPFDSSSCDFQYLINWGDGGQIQNTYLFGGPVGVYYLTTHTYATAGTYHISVHRRNIAGPCAFETYNYFQFTLMPSTRVTSPVQGNVIALTDPVYLTPQPTASQRTPANRSLKVKGTTDCGCDITVNGVSANVSGQDWSVLLPNVQPGRLQIDIHSSTGQNSSISITLIDVNVANPGENQVIPLSATPAMPDLAANVRIDGLPGIPANADFSWNLEAINRWVSRPNRWQDDTSVIAVGTTFGSSAWHPTYTRLLGGWGRLTVTANLPGVVDNPVASEPRWIDLPGTNPGPVVVKSFIQTHAGGDANAVTHIACTESAGTYNQFRPTAQPLSIRYLGQTIAIDAASTLIPADWLPNPAPLRPLFGYPSGIGIMQLDPASFPNQQWDWQQNIFGGINLYREKKRIASNWPVHEFERVAAERAHDIHRVNSARLAHHLPPISMPPADVPNYTADQLQRDTIRGYNGYGSGSRYHEYTYNSGYVISPDHLTLTVSNPGWVTTPGLTNPGYVDNVLGCNT